MVDQLVFAAGSNVLMAACLAIVALVAGRLIRRPVVSHVLWLLVLARLVAPPLVGLPVLPGNVARADVLHQGESSVERVANVLPDVTPSRGESEPSRAEAATVSPTKVWKIDPWRAMLGLWLASAALILAVALVRIVRFRGLLSRAEEAPSELLRAVDLTATRLGIRRVPRILLVPDRVPPLLWSAFGSPRVVLPRDLFDRLRPAERNTLVAHELAHFKRRDHWVRYLELVVGAVFWWYPVAWWARRALRAAEEQCCDALVLGSLPGCARAYAESLCTTAEFLARPVTATPAVATGSGDARNLKARLMMILSETTPRRFPRMAAGILALAAVVAVTIHPVRAAISPGVRTGGGDAVTLRLHRADVKDVMGLFSQLTGMTFFADPGIGGLITTELDAAPWYDVLADALEGVGLSYTLENRMVRVASARTLAAEAGVTRAQAPRPVFTGDPINLTLKDADVVDVLETITGVVGLELELGPGVSGEVTVSMPGVPWDEMLHTVVEICGLSYELTEDGVLRVFRPTNAFRPDTTSLEGKADFSKADARIEGNGGRFEKVPYADAALTGVVEAGTSRYALVRMEKGAGVVMQGTRFADGAVSAIADDRIVMTVDGTGSSVEMLIPRTEVRISTTTN